MLLPTVGPVIKRRVRSKQDLTGEARTRNCTSKTGLNIGILWVSFHLELCFEVRIFVCREEERWKANYSRC